MTDVAGETADLDESQHCRNISYVDHDTTLAEARVEPRLPLSSDTIEIILWLSIGNISAATDCFDSATKRLLSD